MSAETLELTLHISQPVNEWLEEWAEKLDRDKEKLVLTALVAWLEDQDDIAAADEVLRQSNGTTYLLEEVWKLLGLDERPSVYSRRYPTRWRGDRFLRAA